MRVICVYSYFIRVNWVWGYECGVVCNNCDVISIFWCYCYVCIIGCGCFNLKYNI